MDVRFTREGVFLPALDLWLDPSGPRPSAFLSHARVAPVGAAHGLTICTRATADLLVDAGDRGRVRVLEGDESIEWNGARISLHASGHVLGAAQLRVEHGGERLVYTGALKVDPPLLGEPAEIVACDHLVVESTFGLPIFRFLEASEARSRIVAIARRALAEGVTPIFLGSAFGRSQEIVAALSEAGVPVAVEGPVARYLDAYRALTGRAFACVPSEKGLSGHAIVGPPSFGRRLGAGHANTHVVAVSGWALLDHARQRFGADELVAYSDHAGFDELVRYVEACGAKRVDVIHGFSEPFASILRGRGLDARAPKEAAAPIDQEESEP